MAGRVGGTMPLTVATAALACSAPHSALEPASQAGAVIETLWWVLFGVCLFVLVAVLAGWAYAFLRRRPGGEPEGEGRALMWILVAGAIIPGIILAGLTAATIRTSSRIAGAGAADALEVDVVGHQFWWEIRYPEAGVVTANELHIPAGRPVRLRLASADVIHSIWIPRLHGKLDLTPGRSTSLLIEADEPGEYRGFCAEFCGQQHALMGLLVMAQPEPEFQAWLDRQARPAAESADDEARHGRQLFIRYDCHLCHRIRGANFPDPPGQTGPDLTHLASRRTLAAGTLENERGILASWVLDPHGAKPGVRMPATRLEREELFALVAYLEGLR